MWLGLPGPHCSSSKLPAPANQALAGCRERQYVPKIDALLRRIAEDQERP
jgi:hypothetical protein